MDTITGLTRHRLYGDYRDTLAAKGLLGPAPSIRTVPKPGDYIQTPRGFIQYQPTGD